MIWLLKPDHPKTTEFAPAMAESTGILPRLPAVAGKPVHVGFDGGRLTSDAGILLLSAVEQRLRIAESLASCPEDPRDPDRVQHKLAEMIRYRALLIAAGYPEACPGEGRGQRLRCAAFRSRLQDGGRATTGERCRSVFAADHPPARNNLPGPTALKRMMAAMVEVFCDSFDQVPRRIDR